VFVTSGYNNVNGDTNDGKGYLYVLNAITGKIIKKIGTNIGDSTTPSGLGKINNWVDNALFDNTTLRVYGADLLGNVWRFDVNGASASGSVAQLMATAKDSLGNAQSITTKPELALVRGQPFVYVATGRYLGSTDISNTQAQSVYAMRDPLTSTASPTVTPVWANLRSFAKITITDTTLNGALSRTAVCSTNCSSTDGWFADLPDSGERVNVDIKLQLGTLTVLSNVPQNDACTIGGFSFINFFDYTSGLPISTAANGAFGYKIADSLAVGMNIVRLPSGKTVAITTTSDSKQNTGDVPIDDPGVGGRRISWREIGE
jgi:type IV pilus assembly protein PilY1